MLAERLANRLADPNLTEDQMKAILEDHERDVSQMEDRLAAEKDKHMAELREKLRRRREEREAALLRKLKEEVSTWCMAV